MTQGTRGDSIMGGRNEQAYLRRRNTNGGNISSIYTHRMVGGAKEVTEPDPNTTGSNDANTNTNTCYIGQNFIFIAYTNLSEYVYPYSEAYEPIENVPIVYGAKAYDHAYGNTYILIFHYSIYYVSQMKHRLINADKIRSNFLEFYYNPDRDEDIYVELDDNPNVPLQFKGTNCTFLLCVSTWQELETFQYFDMTSDHGWYPQYIDLNKIHKISQSIKLKRSVFWVQWNTVYISPFSDIIEGVYDYQNPTSDEDILSVINPSLVQLK